MTKQQMKFLIKIKGPSVDTMSGATVDMDLLAKHPKITFMSATSGTQKPVPNG